MDLSDRDIVQNGTLLCIEKLERFRNVSSLMIPGCFGGFKKDDVVCEKFCGRAHTSDLLNRALKIREKMGIEPSSTFFGDELGVPSCQMKRLEIEVALIEAKQRLATEKEEKTKIDLRNTVSELLKKLKWLDDMRIWNQRGKLYEEKKLPDDPKLKELARELSVESQEKVTVIIESKHKA